MFKYQKDLKKIIRSGFITAGLLGITSVIGYIFHRIGFPETNVVIIYIFAVLLTARLTDGYGFGILASISATFAFNYIFTMPYYTFSVNDPSYIITFTIMTITAIVTSALTSRVKQNAKEAKEKETETSALYRLTNRLTDASDIQGIASISVEIISDIMACKAACLCTDVNGVPERSFIQQVTKENQIHRSIDDVEELWHRIEGLRTGYDVGDEFYDWPIYGQESILGILRIPKENAELMNDSQARLLRTMIESIALAMDRFLSAQQRIKSHEEVVQERYRGNLLRAISHDLRTPLSSIMGTSEMLMDMMEENDPKHALAEGIHKDADWLHSLVENILSLTRLQEGRLVLNKEMEAVEEIIGSAVNRILKRFPEYEIKVNTPEEVLFVPMDAKLIEQVLINLLDNAIKHSHPQNEICISVKKEAECNEVEICVMDSGEGIAYKDLPNIFQMFYTSNFKYADAKHGIGLGLTICEAIIKAHGGRIEASNRSNGQGAMFRITLPVKEEEHVSL